MTEKKSQSRIYVMLTAFWCYGDAQSTIRISRKKWRSIEAGSEYGVRARSWYEGKRYLVWWSFANGEVCIDGEGGMQCVLDRPVNELVIELRESVSRNM